LFILRVRHEDDPEAASGMRLGSLRRANDEWREARCCVLVQNRYPSFQLMGFKIIPDVGTVFY